MIQDKIHDRLARVARRIRWHRLWCGLGLVWAVTAAVLTIGWWMRRETGAALWSQAWVIVIAALGVVAALAVAIGSARDSLALARRIERAFPELKDRLLTAVEQRPDARGHFGFLQQNVLWEALAHDRRVGWQFIVPPRAMMRAQAMHGIALLSLVMAIVVARHDLSIHHTPPSAERADPGVDPYRIVVEPGDTELERGTALLVMARFKGDLPPDARLHLRAGAGEWSELSMSRSLDDPLFAVRVPELLDDATYYIAYGAYRTPDYQATVYDHPELVRSDARLVFPEYTALDEKLIEDTRRVSALEGTRLTWLCRLNKPVEEARFEPIARKAGETLPPPIALARDSSQEGSAVYTAAWTLSQSAEFRLVLTDDRGRQNKQPPRFVVQVTRNGPPQWKIVRPGRDVQASPLEEVALEAEARDDLGLEAYGLSLVAAGAPPRDIPLGKNVNRGESSAVRHLLELETLAVMPDDLVSYYYWAIDRGPDGQPRRTASDMYFIEVRPFDEIFRQGDSPPASAGQSGAAQQAEQIAELQKQVINATWKLIRERPTGEARARDVGETRDGQQTARQMTAELAERLNDPRSKTLLQGVQRDMERAIDQLNQAQASNELAPLEAALSAEQAAYQGLLKLRAHEHNITRSRNSQAGGGAAQARQGQLEQLELDEEQNRYEQQRTAQSENPQQRELRQALNRLRELARRQTDLNEQLAQLRSALDAAQDDKAREEARRQLERLRSEQEQMLRDTDELRQRAEQENAPRELAESREALERTRENVRRASDALEQGQVSQAAAAGQRAEDELNELRDRVRDATSSQFAEELRGLRSAARQLESDQKKVSTQLAENAPKEPSPSLRDPDAGRDQLAEEMQRQSERLDQLLERMRETIEQSEASEPLLSRTLYDAFRGARQQRLDELLRAGSELLRRGLPEEARQAEQLASPGIEQLRQGVERAAESVLGNEAEALRRARQELDRLAQDLSRELAANDPRAVERGANVAPRPTDEPMGGQGSRPIARPGDDEQGEQRPDGEQQPQGQEASDERGGRHPGNRPSGDQPGSQQPGNQPMPDQQPGQRSGANGQPSSERSGPPNDERPGTQSGGAEGNGAQPSPEGNRSLRGQRGDPQPSNSEQNGLNANDGAQGAMNERAGGPGGPIAGEGFRDWSDRLRDVEEMIDDPQLRAQAAQVRDRARAARAEFKRHSQEPNWELVRTTIAAPLDELRQRVHEELLRRTPEETLTPIDRDPVPPPFVEPVRRYYERLGSGR